MVFDTHPCAAQGAQRVFGSNDSRPCVCTMNEYSDIFGVASTDSHLNYPTFCCCGPAVPHHDALLQKLRSQYPYLRIEIQNLRVGGRWIFVLKIRRKQEQQQQSEQQRYGHDNYYSNPLEISSSQSLPPPIAPPSSQIPIVQGIPIDDRK